MTTNPRWPATGRAAPALGAALASAALLALPGCTADQVSQSEHEVVAPNLEVFVTDAPGVDKFKGFNEVYDIVHDSCLKRCNDADNAPRVHSDESGLSVSFVSSAAEVASSQTFTLDANIEMALHAGNLDVNASMKLANKTNFSRKAVRMLLIANRWFRVAHNEQMQIDPAIANPELLMRSKAASDEQFDDRLMQFIGRCGHVYIKEKIHGAYLFALYEFTSTDESKLSGLEAKLGGAFRSHVGKIGGGVQVGVQNELSQALSNVQWSVQVVAKGFKINGEDGDAPGRIALEQGGQGGLDLQRIVGFFDAMQKSVGDDMRAIQVSNDEHPQSVFPLGLIAGYYPLLIRNPGEHDVARARTRMSDIQNAHDRMLQTYGALASGVINGRDDARRFLALPADLQAQHQVMKWSGKPHTPAEKLRADGAGLLDRVEPFGGELDPRAGTGPASDLARRVLDCWRWGRSGDLKRCVPDLGKPVEAATGEASFTAALNKLRAYNDTARPIWLDYYFPLPAQVVARVRASCAAGGATGHLPSLDESRSMGLVAWHRVPAVFRGRTSFWLAGAECADEGWEHSFRYHHADQSYRIGCARPVWTEAVVCVNANGLFPASLPKLYPAGGF